MSQSWRDSSQEESNREFGLVVWSKLTLLLKLLSSTSLPLCQSTAVWVSPFSDLCRDWITKSAFDITADFGKLRFSQKRK